MRVRKVCRGCDNLILMLDFENSKSHPDNKDVICKMCRGSETVEGDAVDELTKEKDSSKKQIEQVDRKTGEVIDTWDSIKLAAAELGKGHAIIGKALRGKSKSAHGFHWRYKQN